MRWGFNSRPLTLTTMYGEGDGNKWGLARGCGFDAVRVTDIIESSADDLLTDPQHKWAEVDDKLRHYADTSTAWTLDMSYVRNRIKLAGRDPYADSEHGLWQKALAGAYSHCKAYPPLWVSLAGEPELDTPIDRLIGFYKWAAGVCHGLDSSIPVCAGGWLHYDRDGAHRWGPRRTVVEAGCDLAAVHVYSGKDIEALEGTIASVHAVGARCVVEELGVEQGPGRRWRARNVIRACWNAGADGIGVWNLYGDPDGQYALAPGRDEDVLELFRSIRRGRRVR